MNERKLLNFFGSKIVRLRSQDINHKSRARGETGSRLTLVNLTPGLPKLTIELTHLGGQIHKYKKFDFGLIKKLVYHLLY